VATQPIGHFTESGSFENPTKPIFRCNGEYFGFLHNEALFAAHGSYLGWVDENRVWRKDGTFWGQIVEHHFILKKRIRLEPLVRPPQTRPDSTAPPLPSNEPNAADAGP
jgi:hypothetical protein